MTNRKIEKKTVVVTVADRTASSPGARRRAALVAHRKSGLAAAYPGFAWGRARDDAVMEMTNLSHPTRGRVPRLLAARRAVVLGSRWVPGGGGELPLHR
ncbi:hypothetical protein C8046_00005, partial [Serinibacter arcticus]